MSRPWMPFYVRDYLADTVHLSTLEQGSYLLLILYYWQHEGLPTDDAKLARIVRSPCDQWMEIRPTIADFFEPDWRHKRIEAELVVTTEKYQKRADAGRQGGRLSGQARQKRTNAEAMLQHQASNAEAGLNQPQPQPHKEESQSEAHAPADMSEEGRFWARLKRLEAGGLSHTRCKQLLVLTGNDFMEANRALDKAEQAKSPTSYLKAIIRRLEQDSQQVPPQSGANLGLSAWVNEKRDSGIPVEREGQHWLCQGRLWTDGGEELG